MRSRCPLPSWAAMALVGRAKGRQDAAAALPVTLLPSPHSPQRPSVSCSSRCLCAAPHCRCCCCCFPSPLAFPRCLRPTLCILRFIRHAVHAFCAPSMFRHFPTALHPVHSAAHTRCNMTRHSTHQHDSAKLRVGRWLGSWHVCLVAQLPGGVLCQRCFAGAACYKHRWVLLAMQSGINACTALCAAYAAPRMSICAEAAARLPSCTACATARPLLQSPLQTLLLELGLIKQHRGLDAASLAAAPHVCPGADGRCGSVVEPA